MKVPIFIRHCSGEVLLTVRLDEPSVHMMHQYEKQTKMKLVHQYFKYGNYTIDPKCSLLSYGVGRDSVVHAVTRLLGGRYVQHFELNNTDVRFISAIVLFWCFCFTDTIVHIPGILPWRNISVII